MPLFGLMASDLGPWNRRITGGPAQRKIAHSSVLAAAGFQLLAIQDPNDEQIFLSEKFEELFFATGASMGVVCEVLACTEEGTPTDPRLARHKSKSGRLLEVGYNLIVDSVQLKEIFSRPWQVSSFVSYFCSPTYKVVGYLEYFEGLYLTDSKIIAQVLKEDGPFDPIPLRPTADGFTECNWLVLDRKKEVYLDSTEPPLVLEALYELTNWKEGEKGFLCVTNDAYRSSPPLYPVVWGEPYHWLEKVRTERFFRSKEPLLHAFYLFDSHNHLKAFGSLSETKVTSITQP